MRREKTVAEKRALLGYLSCTGALCGVIYSLVLAVWAGGWREPQLVLFSLLSLKTLWFAFLMAVNGAVWFAGSGLALAAVAAVFRPFRRPLWLLLAAAVSAAGAALPYLLLGMPQPPVFALFGSAFDFYGLRPPVYAVALAGAAAGWVMSLILLPYGEEVADGQV